MDYIKEYRSFVNSYYLSEGIRISFGLTLPALLLSYFNNLPAGISMSLGASCVIMVDNAGPIHHRRNAMMICDALIFLVALATGFAAHFPLLLGILIFAFCFFLSMIGVFGSRASSIGLAGLFIMVLSIDREIQGWQILVNASYVLAGGIWYTGLSLLLYSFRPYKLTQQAIGECIQSTADYLQTKASFFETGVNYDKAYSLLMREQVSVHEKQDLIRELLFKSRNIIKESTHTGRVLVMIFLDIVDLFERIMTSHQDYQALHRDFENTGILDRYHNLIIRMAEELNEIGIAIKSGEPSEETGTVSEAMKSVRNDFIRLRDEQRTAENVEGFIGLRNILENLEDIAARLHILHSYTTYEKTLAKKTHPEPDYEKFISHQEIDLKMIRDHLSLQSNTFRHALRVAIATSLGYIVSLFFPLGHSYWILLTIIVILKPAYSLSKKRNYARLFGTIAGAAIGLLVLYFVKQRDGIFLCMILFMVGAYSFMRTRYLIFVLLMTPYILLLFYLLNPHDFRTVILDRLVDTAIGSVIAFLANIFLLPAWEHEQVKDYLINMMTDNRNYFEGATQFLLGKKVNITQYKLFRKKAFVSLANVSDAFNRMLAEPRNRQKNIRSLHQFVVLSQMLSSHIATLSTFSKTYPKDADPEEFRALIDGILLRFKNILAILNQSGERADLLPQKEAFRVMNEKLNALLAKRKSELQHGIEESETRKMLFGFKAIADQFNFISKIVADLERLAPVFESESGPETLSPVAGALAAN